MKEKDVSYQIPKIPVPVQFVGVSKIEIPLLYIFQKKKFLIYPSFELFVDLPFNMRGINASRNYQVLDNIIKKYQGKQIRVEDLCSYMATELLRVHEYSQHSLVKFKSSITLPKITPVSSLTNLFTYTIKGYVHSEKRGKKIYITKRSLKLTALGMNACPCAQETIRTIYAKKFLKNRNNEILKFINTTHLQRVEASLELILNSSKPFPNFYFFIDILESSFSSKIYHLLKRFDEAEVIIKAVNNPKFAEDVLRDIVFNFWIKSKNKKFNNSDKINVSVISFESIHPHNLIAKSSFTIDELKRIFSKLDY
jgi:GTP cyclohydrolase-4